MGRRFENKLQYVTFFGDLIRLKQSYFLKQRVMHSAIHPLVMCVSCTFLKMVFMT